MPETKRRIIDLSFNEHKTIRDIARISKKSSRDTVAVLRNSEQNKNIQGNNIPAPKKEKGNAEYEHENLPLSIKAYKLFSEGKALYS